MAPHSERNPFVYFAENHRGPQRPLALAVGRRDIAARQEHQHLVTRRPGNGRPQVAALDIGLQQTIKFAVKAAPVRCDVSRPARLVAPMPAEGLT